jgi:hypothetical protein
MEALPGEELVSLAEYAVMNFSSDYRLVVGHQLELSPSKMVLNTVDLTAEQVKRMMIVGAESGRYEIALYSEMSYFEMALSLFLGKPLIKFNIFLPIEEWTPQTQLLIQLVEQQCRLTRKNVYCFAGLLQRYAHLGYIFV